MIEVASLGLPTTIASNAYEVLDVNIPSVTGLQCKDGDEFSLYNCTEDFAEEAEKRNRFGDAVEK